MLPTLQLREERLIINELKALTSSKGYIYSLCTILCDNVSLRAGYLITEFLTEKEVTLLLKILFSNKVNFGYPENLEEFSKMKKKTFKLMKDLLNLVEAHGFLSHDFVVVPSLYSGTCSFDRQYLDNLENLYRYDSNWLLEKGFDVSDIVLISREIGTLMLAKMAPVRESTESLTATQKRIRRDISFKMDPEGFILLEQYSNFYEFENEVEKMDYQKYLNKTYDNILNIFTVSSQDLTSEKKFSFLTNNFSISQYRLKNQNLDDISDFNILNEKPIINLGDGKYMIPSLFPLFQSIYRTPFFWMLNDSSYKKTADLNRGAAHEDMCYKYLSRLFGANEIYKNVLLRNSANGKDATEIDVLCVFQKNLLCVQVKAKKLTIASRKGNKENQNMDFTKAVQDSYNQGEKARGLIKNNKITFCTKERKEILSLQSIDIKNIYIVCVTEEDYPPLNIQCLNNLNIVENETPPSVMTIFDLDAVTLFIKTPKDFIAYIKERSIVLRKGLLARQELSYLGYFLEKGSFSKIPLSTFMPDSYINMFSRSFLEPVPEKAYTLAKREKNYFKIQAVYLQSLLVHGWRKISLLLQRLS